jgi:transcriptional regulator with XRE-family HTH domain
MHFINPCETPTRSESVNAVHPIMSIRALANARITLVFEAFGFLVARAISSLVRFIEGTELEGFGEENESLSDSASADSQLWRSGHKVQICLNPCSNLVNFLFKLSLVADFRDSFWFMPRKQPLPTEEAEICERVRRAREDWGWPRVELARRVEVDSTYLASIEHLRTPLRYDTAYRIIKALNLNPIWLLEGRGPTHIAATLRAPEQMPGGGRQLFSVAYKAQTQASPEQRTVWLFRSRATSTLREKIDEWIRDLPPETLDNFVQALAVVGDSIAKKCSKGESPGVSKGTLQNDAERLTVTEVKASPISHLLERVRSATVLYGKKAQLAEWLGVPQQRVREWLGGDRSPGGDTTLRLLAWVTEEEAKQNTLASETNTHERKPTHRREHSNENSTGQPKAEPPRKQAAPRRKQ